MNILKEILEIAIKFGENPFPEFEVRDDMQFSEIITFSYMMKCMR